LALDTSSNEQVAIKLIPKASTSNSSLQKEIVIHQSLRHPNIIAFIKQLHDNSNIYLILEVAQGGELFDRIEPDVGLDEELCHFYFFQLLSVIEYLHRNGVAHRDLKPENMLLDKNGNLKLTDFGLSTVFKYRNTKRILETACGTPGIKSTCY
jgi:serine/threonine-protein kinase Chk1